MREEIINQVRRMLISLEKANLPGVIEFFPTARSLFVFYNPLEIKVKNLIHELRILEKRIVDIAPSKWRLFEIPIVYGGEYGPDLENVARSLKLTPEDVIKIHCGQEYYVYATGHMGGTAYFKAPAELAFLPRKKTPDLKAPAGAVCLAKGLGAAFKAMEGPTGWHWIGMCPLRQWFPEKDPPLLILPGDRVRYHPISKQEYVEIKKMVENGQFEARILDSGD